MAFNERVPVALMIDKFQCVGETHGFFEIRSFSGQIDCPY